MDVIPVGPGFGAELRGVTLTDVANDDAAYAAVRAAFEEHSVLVFRRQQVTDDIQLVFSRRFGPPEVTKVGSMGTGSHFVILSTIGPDGSFVLTDDQLEQILQECEHQHMAGGAGGVTTNTACSNQGNCNMSVNSWCWNWSSCQTSANFGGPC